MHTTDRDDPHDADRQAACVDAAAAVLGLPIAPEHRSGVLGYFALAARFAALLDAVPLGPDDESAEVFRPVGPDDLEAGGDDRGAA